MLAGFRAALGCRTNVGALFKVISRESRHAVTTFIGYKAAFYTECQLFLDETLVEAGV